MKKIVVCFVSVFMIASFASSGLAIDQINLTEDVMKKAVRWVGGELVGDISRTEIIVKGKTIAHYTAMVKVGPYKYDTIGIHRVVKERKPGIPMSTEDGILCSAGDLAGFNLIYMPTTLPDPLGSGLTLGQLIGSPDHSLGIFLAKNGIDVWGIDWRWATIPFDPLNPLLSAPIPQSDPFDPGITHLNTDTHLDDFETAIEIARLTRGFTGQGFGKMFVTGFSRGAYMTFALANRQAGEEYDRCFRCSRRSVKGIIPVDHPFKSDNPLIQQTGCDHEAGYDYIMAGNGGVFPPMDDPGLVPPFFNPTGLVAIDYAYKALTAPDVIDSDGLFGYLGVSNKDVFDIIAGASWSSI